MTILVSGATGNIGSQVIQHLVNHGADVRALVRDPSKAVFPTGVAVVKGDFLDVESLHSAFEEFPPCSCSTLSRRTNSPRP